MQLRIARHTQQLDAVVRFYRDGVGLSEVGGFRGHDDYDGVFLAVPGTATHLELTTGGEHGPPAPHPESLLVLYLGDEAAVRAVASRLQRDPVTPANPYWAEHGLTFRDPDGFGVVLVPEQWQTPDHPHSRREPVQVREHHGTRADLRQLFELAEDSADELDRYIDNGRLLVALRGDEVIGHIQLTDRDEPHELEIKNMAVAPQHQDRGIGRALVAAAAALARKDERSTLIVATAVADVGNLRFYQRLGFRMRSIERDAFTQASGYPPGTLSDGIDLRDRVWLDLLVG
jgi:ribosomal protein S18 acetylase RimI-like enzyme